jgi:hypothetical protein
MSRKFSIAYFAHSLRSDWNNGNAHFLRGLLRSLGAAGHDVTIFEPSEEWALTNLRLEPDGERSLEQFADTYPDLVIRPYDTGDVASHPFWRKTLVEMDVVILHEWNPPRLSIISSPFGIISDFVFSSTTRITAPRRRPTRSAVSGSIASTVFWLLERP